MSSYLDLLTTKQGEHALTLPIARSDQLTIRELAEETLVYDLNTHKAHCLNSTVALIWRHCDGQTTVGELAEIVQEELGIADAGALVDLGLEQLARRNLLQQPSEPLTLSARTSRREVLKQLALAAVLLPLVMTITARRVAASVRTLGQPCKPNDICDGVCTIPASGRNPAQQSFLVCIGGICQCPPGSS